jgi:hypothetical protein
MVPMSLLERKDLIQHGAADVTQNPYVEKLASQTMNLKRPLDEPSLQYFYDQKLIDESNKLKKQCDRKRTNEKIVSECWFCLGGSKIEKQYIISVSSKVSNFY